MFGDPKSLIDLRVDPQLRALPQPHAGIERRVRSLASLPAAGQAVRPLIGRAEGRIGLFEERGLAMKVDGVRLRRRRRLGDHRRRVCRQHIVAELIVHTGAQFLQSEVGIDPLGAGEECSAAVAVVGEQIFEPRGPVRRHRRFDAGACCEARSPQKRLFAGARGNLRERQPVIGPGEAARCVKQPAAGSIADAAAHGAGCQHGLAECLRPERRRRQI